MKNAKKIIILSLVISVTVLSLLALSFAVGATVPEIKGEVSYLEPSDDLNALMETATSFVVVKHSPLGGSHYAYTEGLSEESTGYAPEGTESNFFSGAKLILMTLEKDNGKIKQTQYTLLETKSGCIRDPDVSSDGERIVFSYKKSNTDDFHLYEMTIDTGDMVQLTFGSGVADIEPQYTANGDIVFSSSRAIQTVDCWKTPVSNLYKCSPDGSNIVRLGYDQVHTTYPVALSDGRIIYTRWDYNDRTQMFVQGVFQMNADGTNQTELYGNNSSFPTTLVHTREVPGESDMYVSVATGHHTYQAGKLVLLDLSDGRDGSSSVSFVFPDAHSNKQDDVDAFGQSGALYQYPYAINEELFLVSYSKSGWSSNKSKTPFGIYLMNKNGEKTELVSGSDTPCANIIPITGRKLFERPSMVNYASSTGTYYVANVYEGEAVKNVKKGTVKSIRVVALDYRAYAVGATVASGSGSSDPFTPIATGNGSWDVKMVLGTASVYEDGSAMFKVPSEVPVYFQLLDSNGSVIQTMRSWSTLMPGEIYSCVGCHEDNNTAPMASIGVTMALKAGVEELKPEVWQNEEGYDPYTTLEGFSYLEEIQPILDSKCVSCHNNKSSAYSAINVNAMNNSGAQQTVTGKKEKIFDLRSTWKYLIATGSAASGWNTVGFDDSSWASGAAGFGDRGGDGASVGTSWTGNSNYIYIRKTFTVNDIEKYKNASIILNTWYDDTVRFYLNGKLIYSNDGWTDSYVELDLGNTYTSNLVEGTNVLAISVNQHTGGRFIDCGLALLVPDGNSSISTGQISLEGDNIYASRMKRYFPLSYLVLTGSTPRSGVQWVGTPANKYIYWLSSMSKPGIIAANTFGSAKSSLVSRLRSGHGGLTYDEIRTVSAWIDLCVPCYGTYDENNAWNNKDKSEAEEEQNKRDYYNMLNDYARMALSGTLPSGTVTVSLDDITKSGEGIVNLVLNRKYRAGDKITVKLSEGCKYIGFTLSSRMGESIIYCPDGTFTFTLTSAYIKNLYPSTVGGGSLPAYTQNVITVRIPTQAELQETRNLAENAYDKKDSKNAYPHASSDSEFEDYAGDVRFLARNAIDGFSANLGHGAYPVQSWGPSASNNHHIKIDFGREVTVEEIRITIRFDMPHDTYFKSGTIQLSDNTLVNFTLERVGEEQIIKLDKPIKTTFVTIKSLKAAVTGGWAAISEIKVIGHD